MSASALDCAERMCEAVIETLKELKSTSTVSLTPKLLHEALSRKQVFRDLLTHESSTRLDSPERSKVDSQDVHIKKLKDFRLELLSEFAGISTDNFPDQLAEIRKSIIGSCEVDKILALNEDILELVKLSARKVSSELQEFTNLVTDIGKNLVEMESSLVSSFSLNRENHVNSNEFSKAIEQDIEEMAARIHRSKDLAELKGFVFLKLSTIKKALEDKRKFDELQLKKIAREAGQLNQNIKKMKGKMDRAQRRATLLEKESLIDPLTGAYNRRAYEKHIQALLHNYAHREDQAFSILLLDIDNFKCINDTHGHLAGDRCLEELVKLVKHNLRGSDFLARYGGEEFVVILPETDQEGMVIVAEKLRKCIERTRFSCRGQRLLLTISIGCATLKSSDNDPEALFIRADTALYRAKETGRNRVVAQP
jgi:diguanylate cyclase